jgi:hypothetical protein
VLTTDDLSDYEHNQRVLIHSYQQNTEAAIKYICGGEVFLDDLIIVASFFREAGSP